MYLTMTHGVFVARRNNSHRSVCVMIVYALYAWGIDKVYREAVHVPKSKLELYCCPLDCVVK